MAILLVSHDLAVIAGHCDRVIVMYAGMIMESGPVEAVLREPRNPYTLALLEARPRPGAPRGARLKTIPGAPPVAQEHREGCPFAGRCALTHRHLPRRGAAGGRLRRRPRLALPSRRRSGVRAMSDAPLLEVSSLVKTYRSAGVGPFARKNARPALAGVSFSMQQGRSFGIVGESGSGKSTLARIALALDRPDSGAVRLQGRSLFDLPRRELRPMRAHMQMIFQDPYGSLDPRQRVEKIVAEPLAALGGATGAERRARVQASLEAVGLKASDASKHPHEFSGGQRQRIAIARALITRPRLVVADEPVSALDVSVQAQTLNLMSDLEREAGVTFLLISHDLAVVAHICETTAVMYRGRIVEIGETAAMFANPGAPLYARTGRRHSAPRPADTRARSHLGARRAWVEAVAALAVRGGAVSDRAYKADCDPIASRSQTAAPKRPRAAHTSRAAHSRVRAAARRRQALETKDGGSRKVACHFPLD